MSHQFLYKWQTLIGSFLGAAAPISLWFFIEWYQDRKKYSENLLYLEKLFVHYINNVVDTHNTIKNFIENRLSELTNRIDENTKHGRYSVDTAFLPLFSVHPVDDNNLLNINTKSGYLNNKIVQLFRMSKDFALAVDDLRNQFRETLELNKYMAFNKVNSPNVQNNEFKNNIGAFKEAVQRDLLQKNIGIYIKELVSARVAVNAIREIGVIRWRLKFTPSFRCFKNNQDLKRFQDQTFESIEGFLKEKINNQIKEIEKGYDK